MPNPPAAAEALLDLVLRADTRETVCGDLLEEYRDGRVPRVGRRRADLWYWRQVIGIWLRAYWPLVLPLLALLVTDDLFNTFRASSGASYLDALPRAARALMSPFAALGFFALAGAFGSWRAERWESGFVAALGTFVVMWSFMAVWWIATWYPFAHVQQSNPYWIEAWQWSTHRAHPPTLAGFNPDTPDESFLRWIFWDNVGGLLFGGTALMIGSIVCGSLGSALGIAVARRRN